MARLEMSLTASEYGTFVTPPQNFRPTTVGYFQTYNYTYSIAGASGGNTLVDNFSRTATNGWGTADTGQVWSVSGGPVSDYSVSGGSGRVTLTAALDGTNHDTRIVTGIATLTDVDVKAQTWIAAGGTPVAGALVSSIFGRCDGTSNNMYIGRLRWNTNNTYDILINKTVAGVETNIASLLTAGTYVTGAVYWIRLTITGSTIALKVWLNGTTEPAQVQLTVSDTSLTTGNTVGVRTVKSSANTNTNPALAYDQFSVGNVFTDSIRGLYFAPQRFGENWSVDRVTVNDTATTQVPTVFIMRGLIRPDSAFNFAAITYPHQIPPLLATSQLADYTPAGTNDVADITSPIRLSPGEYFSVLFAGSQYPAPTETQTSTVFVGGETTR